MPRFVPGTVRGRAEGGGRGWEPAAGVLERFLGGRHTGVALGAGFVDRLVLGEVPAQGVRHHRREQWHHDDSTRSTHVTDTIEAPSFWATMSCDPPTNSMT